MIIQTLTNNSFLYTVNKYRGRMTRQLERRKAARYFIGLFIAIAVIVMAWIVKP